MKEFAFKTKCPVFINVFPIYHHNISKHDKIAAHLDCGGGGGEMREISLQEEI